LRRTHVGHQTIHRTHHRDGGTDYFGCLDFLGVFVVDAELR
jgi:hypothetical protein